MPRISKSKSTKEIILDTAFSFLEDPRYSAFSMNELAAKVGISKPAIYRHFKNKDALLDAMENKIVDGMSYLLEKVGSDDINTVKESVTNLVQYFIENPSHINYFIAQMSQNQNYEDRLFEKLCQRKVSFVVKNSNAYLTNFKSDMKRFARHIFSGMTIFYFVKLQENYIREGKIPSLPEDFSKHVVDLMIYGLAGCTEKNSPLYPKKITPQRQKEILDLCTIPEDSFPPENRIFTALATVIEKYKITGVTVDKIAAELNMAKSSLYEYFDNKNQMIKSLVNKELALLETIVTENTAEAKNFTEFIVIQMYSALEYFMHRRSIIPICGWLLMNNENASEFLKKSEGCNEGLNFWEKQLTDRITSPDLGFSYSPKVITTWTGVLPVAFLVEAKGKKISKESFMEGFNFMIDNIFYGIDR
ncbi:MAG: TetR/AcrR family transcriptional regulator [Treponema sp.]|nr:TetR/AcrR family transcriptional regulator [Treponema sp.]